MNSAADSPVLRPGTIIAVHLSYASRAAQRGRRPDSPSYFLKPAGSLGRSGDEIERPVGTELLAFEGEIALVIGAAAHRVSAADAWQYVQWVTAANDWGLYDLRANDKGSNLRNKGRDGYTPVGPQLIDARAVDPDRLRVRTWRNGDLVQEGDTADLIFPFARIIADLSQHLTLHPGDIILTGTPAGSSVALPGDVIEVEVDAPASPGEPSSGRLQTRVVDGPGDFDPLIGSLPAVSDLQREEAWGSREAAGLAEPAASMDPELRAKLLRTPVAGLSQQLRKRGMDNVHIDAVRPNRPGGKIVGPARTLRFVANREDLFRSHGGGYNAQKRTFDTVAEGEVIVIEARGERGSGTLGDVLTLRAIARGCAGVVTDGGVRDSATVAELGLPIFSAGPHPAVLGRKHVPWDADLTITCGGATVQPGDIIVGDDDGVLVLPAALAAEVADAALAQEAEDAWIAARVSEGHPVDGLFPMNEKWRARFNAAVGGRAVNAAAAPAALSKSESAYRWIRERITRHDYGPGHRLVLGSIATSLYMSVVPVREAVRRLEAEGLVEFERNVGARVALVDETEYVHVMQTLGLVEGLATSLSAPFLAQADLARAEAVNERLKRLLDEFDARVFTTVNEVFHTALFEPCPNPHVLDLVHRGWHRLAGMRDSTFAFVPGRAHESVAEHDRILQLISSGADPLEIEIAAREHRWATMNAFIARHPSVAPAA